MSIRICESADEEATLRVEEYERAALRRKEVEAMLWSLPIEATIFAVDG